MSYSLPEIAQLLKESQKKVQLIYAFNGTGKTRLSREFKLLVDPKVAGEKSGIKVMYYNAYTEDLFSWDNDLANDVKRKLKIGKNFTNLVSKFLKDEGLDNEISKNFRRFTSGSIESKFDIDFTEVTFSIETGDDQRLDNIKISRGEESNFIWCVFYSLIEQVVTLLNIPEPGDRASNEFDDLEYVFIDDPVSSLDENHLIELAVNLAKLIKLSQSKIKSSQSEIKFIITTHNPLFYNVLYNELNNVNTYLLDKHECGNFTLESKKGDSNRCLSYHIHLKNTIEKAIKKHEIQKYHFTLLRNLYEKTASFLGYRKWSDLLPDDKEAYYTRIIHFTSHSTLSNEVVAEPTNPEKQTVKFLLDHLINNFNFFIEKQEE